MKLDPHLNIALKSGDHQEKLPLSSFIAYRLARLNAKLDQQLEFILAGSCELSVDEWFVMVTVVHYCGPTLTGIKEKTGLPDILLTDILDDLTNKELIQELPALSGEPDGRVTLTPKGQDLFDEMVPIMQARQRMLLAEFNIEERQALYQGFAKLGAAAERTRAI